MFVSQGHEPVAVPDVTGQTPEQAQANLEGSASRSSASRTDAAPPSTVGEVMAVSARPGRRSARSAEHRDIQVSAGLPLVTVPDVSGMNQDEATAALEAVGLKVDATKFFGNKVRQQQPAAGETVEQGTTVKILVTF